MRYVYNIYIYLYMMSTVRLRFCEDMKGFLGEARLDVVLNSLSHDDYIGRSLKLLKPGGRFMEIGKRGSCEIALNSLKQP